MKKLFAISLLTILSFVNSNAQPSFKNDTAYKPFTFFLFADNDSNFHLQKNNQFEFRLGVMHSRTMQQDLFILSLNNNQWSARLFRRIRMHQDTLIELSVSQLSLDKLWKDLKKNNVLTIPESYEIKDRKGKEAGLAIHDGITYWFELISPQSKRNYYYHCPKAYHEEYKYIKAYRNVVSIIKLVYKYCSINPNYICGRWSASR